MNFNKNIIATAAILGALTIGVGAFAAHGLKQVLTLNELATFETGVRYQMYHVFALLVLGTMTGIPKKAQQWIFRFFVLGILLFSGSIYFLAINSLVVFNTKSIGFITPIGGVFFILGWLRWAMAVIVNK